MITVRFEDETIVGVVEQIRAFLNANATLDTVEQPAPKATGGPKREAKPPAEKPSEKAEVAETVADDPQELTYDNVRDAVLGLAAHYGDRLKTIAFLNKFNVSNAKDIAPDKYLEFLAAAKKEIGQ